MCSCWGVEVQRMQEALHRRAVLGNLEAYGGDNHNHNHHNNHNNNRNGEYLPHEMEALNLGVPVPTYHQVHPSPQPQP
jgi:hypothetical protein